MYWYYPLKHVSGHTPSAAIRRSDYKLILDLTTDETRLYNIKKDIAEDIDLTTSKQRLSDELRAQLISFIEENTHKVN